jgi:hypothetical protein
MSSVHDEHPTSGDPPTLRVEARHASFLRGRFESVRTGRLADARNPIGADDAPVARARAFANTCGRIIEGLDRCEIVPHPDVRAALLEAAAVTDEGNRYKRVVGEHEAFAHLLRQLPSHEEGDPPRRGDEPLQRTLLLALLEPPAFGGFLPELARRLGESEDDTRAAAMALENRLLATVQDGYVAATGTAMEFEALCPIQDSEMSG